VNPSLQKAHRERSGRRLRALLGLACLVISCTRLGATILHVPAAYRTVSEALSASADGDTVLVQQGRYAERLVFPTHDLVLISDYWLSGDTSAVSNTILDASAFSESDTASVITMGASVSRATLVAGFTITGGHGGPSDDPTDVRSWGGGLFLSGSDARIFSCRIVSNTATNFPAIYSRGGSPDIETCLIARNCGVEGLIYFGYNLDQSDTVLFRANELTANVGCGGEDSVLWDGGVVCYQARLAVDGCRFHDYTTRESLALELNASEGIVSGNVFERVSALGFGTLIYSSGRPLRLRDNLFRHCNLIDGHCVNIFAQSQGDVSATIERNWFEQISALALGPSCILFQFPNAAVRDNVFLANQSAGSAVSFSMWAPRGCEAEVEGNIFVANQTLNPAHRGSTISAIGSGPFCGLRGNSFVGNQGTIIDAQVSGDSAWDADSNYWGDPSGPYHPTENPQGRGDTVDAEIHVTPWLTEPPEAVPDPRERLRLRPDEWSIDLAYPNPFNSTTTIRLVARKPQPMAVAVYNTLGQRVAEIWRGVLAKDALTLVRWDGRDARGSSVASGVYYIVARPNSSIGSAPKTVKALLLR
jgi:hypothetical protein